MKLLQTLTVPALVLGLLTAPTIAQTPPQGSLLAEETTAKLNREQAEFAQKQQADNIASQAAHNDGVRKQADFEAEKARLANQHEQAMVKWQADVDACEAGDRSRCAPPPAK